jgi:hypothetical protein
MEKKVWLKPEIRVIEAGGAENGKNTGADSKAVPNSGS